MMLVFESEMKLNHHQATQARAGLSSPADHCQCESLAAHEKYCINLLQQRSSLASCGEKCRIANKIDLDSDSP